MKIIIFLFIFKLAFLLKAYHYISPNFTKTLQEASKYPSDKIYIASDRFLIHNYNNELLDYAKDEELSILKSNNITLNNKQELQYKVPSLSKIENKYIYKEDEQYIHYKIETPIFPYWVTNNQIQIYLTKEYIIIKALGSGSSKNLLINEGYKPNNNSLLNIHYENDFNMNNIMRNINYGRDWEIWISLQKPIQYNTVPIIQTKRGSKSNKFYIDIGIPKAAIDNKSDKYKTIPLSQNKVIT